VSTYPTDILSLASNRGSKTLKRLFTCLVGIKIFLRGNESDWLIRARLTKIMADNQPTLKGWNSTVFLAFSTFLLSVGKSNVPSVHLSRHSSYPMTPCCKMGWVKWLVQCAIRISPCHSPEFHLSMLLYLPIVSCHSNFTHSRSLFTQL